MRIVGGRFRGRRLATPETEHGPRAKHAPARPAITQPIRPTSDRVREAVFNRLNHGPWAVDGDPVIGAYVLDAFCGTGALGLEALSRGAERVWFLDKARSSLDLARRNAATLGGLDHCRFLVADLPRCPTPEAACDLVFLDPPYGQELVTRTLDALTAAGWLAAGALVVVETADRESIGAVTGFDALGDWRYGQTRITMLRWRADR